MKTEEEIGERPNPPREYDMENKEDMKRWFREMEGYLKTEDFLNQGTDREGRVYAMDGFRQLRVLMYKHHAMKKECKCPVCSCMIDAVYCYNCGEEIKISELNDEWKKIKKVFGLTEKNRLTTDDI